MADDALATDDGGSMATVLKPRLATLDKAFCEAVAGLPQVTRVVAVQSGVEPN